MPPWHVRPPAVPPSAHDPYSHESPSFEHTEPSFGAIGGHGAGGGVAQIHSACAPQGSPPGHEQPQNVSPNSHSPGSTIASQVPEGCDAGHAGSGAGSVEQPGMIVSQPFNMHLVAVRHTITMPSSASHTSPAGAQASPSAGGVTGQGEHAASASSTQAPSALHA